MKPYQSVVIQDCGEPLVPLPLEQFAVLTPHPYQVLGAPYGDRSPYWLRASVVQALVRAQEHLQAMRPGWRIQIFDAYRPIPVQQFMVDYTAHELAQKQGLDFETLPPSEQDGILNQVYQFWAIPSLDPKSPPPHSTGAAVDVTLMDADGQPVDMGSPIDEISVRSHPNHFEQSFDPKSQHFHANRCLLRQVLIQSGFQQHPNEWWHFSSGDQLWAWLKMQASSEQFWARYGRLDD
ncbi:MAG: M15 family metallopeptidase [Cyanobacteria bacterium J06639_14]